MVVSMECMEMRYPLSLVFVSMGQDDSGASALMLNA